MQSWLQHAPDRIKTKVCGHVFYNLSTFQIYGINLNSLVLQANSKKAKSGQAEVNMENRISVVENDLSD